MEEGKLLKYFISKREGLVVNDMCKEIDIKPQSLYQYYKSKELQPGVKQKFKDYFKEDIFTEKNYEAYLRDKDNTDDNIVNEENNNITRPVKSESAIEKTLQDLAAANKLLAEANIIFAEAQRNFSESNRTLAETNKQLMYRAGPTVGSGSQKGAIALATTAALQDLLFEKLAPMFETTKEELDEVLRNKVSAYRNLRVKDRIQTG